MDNRGIAAPVGLLLVGIVVLSLLVTGVGVAGSSTPGYQQQSATDGAPVNVSHCRTIDAPGRYVLTQDIMDSSAEECITIVANDVVFDGQGHTLDAREVSHQTEAIAAGYTDPPIENVTLKNFVVTDWTQGVGCRAIASNVTVKNVTARRNGLEANQGTGYGQEAEGYGIYVGDLTHNVTVRDSTVERNSLGIFISDTTNNVIRDNVIRNNTDGGVKLGGQTRHNQVNNNHFVANGDAGIFVRSQPKGNATRQTQIRNNTLQESQRGVVVRRTDTPVSIANNTFVNTTDESILVAGDDGDVVITDNRLHQGDGDGIVLRETGNAIVRDNRIRDVAGTGISLTNTSTAAVLSGNHLVGAQRGLQITNGSGRILVRKLFVAKSSDQAVLFDGAGNNTLASAQIRRGHGIEVKTAGNRLENLTVVGTETYGIRLAGAANTSINNVSIRHTGAEAFEAVGKATTVKLRNLSLTSGRVSLSGSTVVISSVDRIPSPPSDNHAIGVAVRVWNTASESERNSSTMLTVYYPEGATNVTLWRRTFGGSWGPFDNSTAQAGRNAISVLLPPGADFIVVPMSPTPHLTSTKTPTPPPDEPIFEMPGFGIGVTLVGLVVIGSLSARIRWL